jgi:hypothetical protein
MIDYKIWHVLENLRYVVGLGEPHPNNFFLKVSIFALGTLNPQVDQIG